MLNQVTPPLMLYRLGTLLKMLVIIVELMRRGFVGVPGKVLVVTL